MGVGARAQSAQAPAPVPATAPATAAAAASKPFPILEYQVAGNTLLSTIEVERAVLGHLTEQGTIKDIKAAIARKTIHAPFSGILGIRQISLGQ